MTLRAMTVASLIAMPALSLADGHEDDARALFEALQLPEIISIMREEGLTYGDQIAADMFPGPPPAEWTEIVEALYDPETMETAIFDAFAAELEGSDIAAMTAFFSAEPGATIITLETEARRARLDPEVEQISIEAVQLAAMDQDPRLDQLQTFVEVNDLVETNVVSAMNFNYAFFLGLVEGGVTGDAVTEDQILADVWSQEPAIREQTTEWVYSFLFMAYTSLSDEDLQAYIAFSETDAGQDLNRAIIGAFDPVYTDISLGLGRGAAQMMMVQEL